MNYVSLVIDDAVIKYHHWWRSINGYVITGLITRLQELKRKASQKLVSGHVLTYHWGRPEQQLMAIGCHVELKDGTCGRFQPSMPPVLVVLISYAELHNDRRYFSLLASWKI